MNTSENTERSLSEAQLAANRANAQKSTGPTSSEGKAKASMNALKHGCCASAAWILQGENKDKFEKLHQDYRDRLQPVDACESSLIEHIANVDWKLRRLRALEDAFIEIEIRNPSIDLGYSELTGHFRIAKALERCIEKGTIPYVSQYLNRLSRELSRLIKTFFQLRNSCAPRPPAAPVAPLDQRPPTENVQNEPNPVVAEIGAKAEIVGSFRWTTIETKESRT